jgi:hypothetical protein
MFLFEFERTSEENSVSHEQCTMGSSQSACLPPMATATVTALACVGHAPTSRWHSKQLLATPGRFARVSPRCLKPSYHHLAPSLLSATTGTARLAGQIGRRRSTSTQFLAPAVSHRCCASAKPALAIPLR